MLDRLLAPRRFADGTPSSYRLGLVETHLGPDRLALHSGSLPGYRNHLVMAPDLGVGVVLLLNRDEDPLPPVLGVMTAFSGGAPPWPSDLPVGLFAAEEGPFWAEVLPGAIEYMGARETLADASAEDGRGCCRSLPSTLEISLDVVADDSLEGRFGGVRRRLLRVPDGLALDHRLAGLWRDDLSGAELLIRPDGTARWPWAGGLGREVSLTPLPGARALAPLTHLMWRQRPCLWLHGDGTLRVASHRARVLRLAHVADAPA